MGASDLIVLSSQRRGAASGRGCLLGARVGCRRGRVGGGDGGPESPCGPGVTQGACPGSTAVLLPGARSAPDPWP